MHERKRTRLFRMSSILSATACVIGRSAHERCQHPPGWRSRSKEGVGQPRGSERKQKLARGQVHKPKYGQDDVGDPLRCSALADVEFSLSACAQQVARTVLLVSAYVELDVGHADQPVGSIGREKYGTVTVVLGLTSVRV